MTAVNPLSRSRAAGAHEPVHAAAQMGRLMRHLSSTFAREDWNGLRQSHFRLMSSIPVAGITITDLADRLGMTKQASGQFVTTLAADGYLDVRADPDDRRARLVFLTTQGVRTLRAVNARIEHSMSRKSRTRNTSRASGYSSRRSCGTLPSGRTFSAKNSAGPSPRAAMRP